MSVKVVVKRPPAYGLKIAFATVAVFACVGLLARFLGTRESHTQPDQAHWQVFFSPGGGCSQEIIQRLSAAKQNVLVQAYEFTSEPIAEALVSAEKRGVSVAVILDQSKLSESSGIAKLLSQANVRILADGAHAINHNKVMIIDNATVITGSFNFTVAAEERNAENLLIIEDNNLAQRYTENWYSHVSHSKQIP